MFALLMLCLGVAQSATLMRAEDGTAHKLAVHETVGMPYLPLTLNPENTSGVAHSALRHATIEALQRWQYASNDAFAFDMWSGREKGHFPTTRARDGVSTLHFASQASRDEPLDARTAAYTQLWLDEDGAIVEADIVLNDLSYTFVTDPAQAGYESHGANRNLYLPDVITHELGHAIGLDHSGVMGSTQFAWSWHDQSHLSCDDELGIRDAYNTRDTELAGQITGIVRTPTGGRVHAAQITAISLDRGVVVRSTLSDAEGWFDLGGLKPGEYSLVVEPFLGGAAETLSEYYRDADQALCDGRLFARTFFTRADSSELRRIEVTAGGRTAIGGIEVDCTEDGGARILDSGAGPTTEEAALLPTRDLAFVDYAPSVAERRHYLLKDLEGSVSVAVITHSLFSPVWHGLELLDSNGLQLRSEVDAATPAWRDEATKLQRYDGVLTAHDLPPGDYWLTLRGGGLPEELFPRPDLYVDPSPFVVISVTRDQTIDNTPCQMPDPDFALYTSPPCLPGICLGTTGCSVATVPRSWALLACLPLLMVGRRRRNDTRADADPRS